MDLLEIKIGRQASMVTIPAEGALGNLITKMSLVGELKFCQVVDPFEFPNGYCRSMAFKCREVW